MNRQEAIRHIVDLAKHLDKIDEELEAEKLLAALGRLISEPEPDPETGLVPCGCGGQAVFEGNFLDEEVPSSYRVSLSCIECGISTIAYEYEQEATKAWNTAVGWKSGTE